MIRIRQCARNPGSDATLGFFTPGARTGALGMDLRFGNAAFYAIGVIHAIDNSPSNVGVTTAIIAFTLDAGWRDGEHHSIVIEERGSGFVAAVAADLGFPLDEKATLAEARRRVEVAKAQEARNTDDVEIAEDWLRTMGDASRTGDTSVIFADDCEDVLVYHAAVGVLIPPLRQI